MTSEDATRYEKQFWARVQWTDTCWLWTGARFKPGYGRLAISRSQAFYAHRLAYELLVGPIPLGKVLHHACGVKGCVNPDHLEVMAQGDHMRLHNQGHGKRRQLCRKGLHAMTDDNIYLSPCGDRFCQACKRAYSRAYMANYKRPAKIAC